MEKTLICAFETGEIVFITEPLKNCKLFIYYTHIIFEITISLLLLVI